MLLLFPGGGRLQGFLALLRIIVGEGDLLLLLVLLVLLLLPEVVVELLPC